MSIDYTDSLQEIAAITDVWCFSSASAGTLVSAADVALRAKAKRVAVHPLHVHIVWSWMEGKDTEVFAAFQEPGMQAPDPSQLAAGICAAFKKGAAGVIIPGRREVISALLPVRHDLFFGKKLLVLIDLKNIGGRDWPEIFDDLKKMNADGVLLDTTGARSKGGSAAGADVCGKFYGFLENFDNAFSGSVSVMSGNPEIMESVLRLARKMRPDIAKGLRFFVEHR